MPQILDSLALASEDLALRAMFAARKRVFVDLLKWNVPVISGRYEVDQFDTRDADYLILLDHAQQHRASARLLRTERPHLLSELYPFLCERPAPSGPTVREITRFCLDPLPGAAERRHARDQLVFALVDHALQEGITDYTGVATLGWFAQIVRFGWHCVALGAPTRVGDQTLVALHICVDERTRPCLEASGLYREPAFRLAGNRQVLA